MRAKVARIWVLGITGLVLMVSLILSFYLADSQSVMDSLVIEGRCEDNVVELTLWQDEDDGGYYLFLPSWFSGRNPELTFRYDDASAFLVIDGVRYPDKNAILEGGKEEIHEFTVMSRLGKELLNTTLQVLASDRLPAIFIAVEEKESILSEEVIPNKQYLETGLLEMRNETGQILCSEELSGFKVRGNSTALCDKKSFALSFKKPVSMLGMEPAYNYHLLANAMDGSYIRNKIMADLNVKSVDFYEPQGEFTEVYLNGEYQGLYLLSETVEFGENRIPGTAKDNWLVEIELYFRSREDETEIITDKRQFFVVKTKEWVSKTNLENIRMRLNDIESALYAEDGVSTISGKKLEELIDIKSFAQAWLIEELSGDHDVGITSQYFYAGKEQDDLWYAGPAWDFDCCMGNVNTPFYAVPESLTGVIAISRPEEYPSQNLWLGVLWNHPVFQEEIKKIYHEDFRDNYAGILENRIDDYVKQIRRGAVLDAFRWHENRFSWWFVDTSELKIPETGDYKRFDTLDYSVAIVNDFMTRKLAFLDKLWIENSEFCIVEIENNAEFLDPGYHQTLYYWVEKGMPIEHLPHYEPEGYIFEGYFDKATGEPITDGLVMEHDRIVEGRWTKGEDE